MKFKIISAIVYQFVILFTIVGLTVYFAVKQGEINELLLGSLIGVMMGLSIKPDDDIGVVGKDTREDDIQ